jgi:hypothetical protein
MRGAIPSLPSTPSWHRDNFTFNSPVSNKKLFNVLILYMRHYIYFTVRPGRRGRVSSVSLVTKLWTGRS